MFYVPTDRNDVVWFLKNHGQRFFGWHENAIRKMLDIIEDEAGGPDAAVLIDPDALRRRFEFVSEWDADEFVGVEDPTEEQITARVKETGVIEIREWRRGYGAPVVAGWLIDKGAEQ